MTHQASRRVGDLEVVALLDAQGSFGRPWEPMFPNAAAEDWRRARAADPAAFGPDGTWRLSFHCFAIRRPDGKVLLVDVGIGPAESPASSWAPVPGRLPDALREAGIEADDVDVVVVTHLHEDHLGWAVLPDRTPLFPEARYVVQRDEISHLAQQPDRTIWDYVVTPLLEADQLEQLDGRSRLLSGSGGAQAYAIPTPATPSVTSRWSSRTAATRSWSPATCWSIRSSCSTPTSPTTSRRTGTWRDAPGNAF